MREMTREALKGSEMSNLESLNASQKYRFGLPGVNTIGGVAEKDVGDLPEISEREFGRIVVLLGANGSGKSRLLRAFSIAPKIDPQPMGATSLVYVEGGRAIQPSFHNSGQEPQGAYAQNRTLAGRVSEMFYRLESERSRELSDYKDKLYEWSQSGSPLESKPTEKESRFAQLSAGFSAIFPRLKLSLAPDDSHKSGGDTKWVCVSGDRTYDLAKLSDGEKQVLCLLGDVGILSSPESIIIVDEPELNLHPGLAINFWGIIERLRDKSLFIYATHSLSFAMRSSVTDVIVLRDSGQPVHLPSPADLNRTEAEAFLGAIPAIVTAGRLMVVEGVEKSFDNDFYRWVVGQDVTVSSAGSCDNVKGAVKHHGVWQTIGELKIFGVTDRDYRNEDRIKQLEGDGCYVLGYHEAESYLCHPDVLVDAAKRSGASKPRKAFVDELLKQCRELLVRVAIRRTLARTEVRLATGTDRQWPKDKTEARAAIEQAARSESERSVNYVAFVTSAFDAEYQKCEAAITEDSIDAALAIFPGKELLQPLAAAAGFNKPSKLLNSVVAGLDPTHYPPLVKVANAARAKLGQHAVEVA